MNTERYHVPMLKISLVFFYHIEFHFQVGKDLCMYIVLMQYVGKVSYI